MNSIWKFMGKLAFWSTWPLLWIYLRRGCRSRVLIINDGCVLLVHNWHSSGKWSLPGGGINRGEDPKVGAVREAREETGIVLEPNQLQLLSEGESHDRGLSYKYICFFVETDQRVETKGRILEITDVTWVPIMELNQSNAATDTLRFVDAWQHR